MKRTFRIRLEGEETTVTVERQGDDLVVERNGESYRVTILENATTADSSLTSSASSPDSGSDSTPGRGATAEAARSASAVPRDRAERRSQIATPATHEPPTGHPASAAAVCAPVTGTIKEVLAEPGDTVSQGERVVMMEAMKMDIEIVAPRPGKISHLYVKAGDGVREHEPLFTVE